jgi:hypothetical protein
MLYSFNVNGNKSKDYNPLFDISKTNLKQQLIEFLILNPHPEDEQIHKLAEINKVDKHEFEEIAYSLLGNLLSGGKSRGILPINLDEEQLKMGIEVEYEHTKDIEIATKIAIDHLHEIKDYYTRLAKMEIEANKK